MSEQANTLPPEWKECAAETVRVFSVARHLAARHATEETPGIGIAAGAAADRRHYTNRRGDLQTVSRV
jgi:hypothetical protein